jgi:hypothetical protein
MWFQTVSTDSLCARHLALYYWLVERLAFLH